MNCKFCFPYCPSSLISSSTSCPSISECNREHFQNAIFCDGDVDLSSEEGPPTFDTWRTVNCWSAFDNLDKDASQSEVDVAIAKFKREFFIPFMAMRKEAGWRHRHEQDALFEKNLPPPPPPPPPPPALPAEAPPLPELAVVDEVAPSLTEESESTSTESLKKNETIKIRG